MLDKSGHSWRTGARVEREYSHYVDIVVPPAGPIADWNKMCLSRTMMSPSNLKSSNVFPEFSAAGRDQHTQWLCTAVYFCPGA
jgi:hypothetical protein